MIDHTSKLPEAPRIRRTALSRFVVIVALLAFGAGWGLAAILQDGHSGPLKITGHFTGTVTAVDLDGSAFCVTPPSKPPRCSIPFMRPGQPKLQMGQRVSVSVQWLNLGGGSSEEIFVITSPGPGT